MTVEVSILCTAYNQEGYIRDAVLSFLKQRTTFEYEILINDDCSTDGTRAILQKLQNQCPDKIHVVYQHENQYSKGVDINKDFLFPLAKGKYVALCEGDDYWTSSDKLQKQFDALERNPSCGFCVHASYFVEADSKRELSLLRPFESSRIIDKRVLLEAIHPFATNSYFIRSDLYKKYLYSSIQSLPTHGDQKMSVFFALHTDTYYLSDALSAYRVLAKNSINSFIVNQSEVEKKKIALDLLNRRNMLADAANEISSYKFKDSFAKAKVNHLIAYCLAVNDFGLLKLKCPNAYSRIGMKTKVKLFLKERVFFRYSVLKRLYRIRVLFARKIEFDSD